MKNTATSITGTSHPEYPGGIPQARAAQQATVVEIAIDGRADRVTRQFWNHAVVTARRVGQLLVACVVLGVGVALLLLAALGSDGYSTMINGISLSTGLPLVVVNCAVGGVLVAMAWVRGTRPGLGTIVQPVVVGFTISGILAVVDRPHDMLVRLVLMVVALPILTVGVAGYLGSGTGAGPTEAAALAWDPPAPFRWSYSVLQGGGALVGWLLGAAIGPGTLVVIFLLGPAVDLIARWMPIFNVNAGRAEQPQP